MSERLGVFDSGIGGVTVIDRIHARLPSLPIIYFADTAHTPYGEKDPCWVSDRSLEIVRFLEDEGATAIAVACGTASVCALELLQRESCVPVFSVVEPLVRATKGNRVALLATNTTVRSGKLATAIEGAISGRKVTSFACPEFVPLLESWCHDADRIEEVVYRALRRLDPGGYDSVILGCTHYPLLSEVIAQHLCFGVPLINIAEVTADALCALFSSSDFEGPAITPEIHVSADPIRFEGVLRRYFPCFGDGVRLQKAVRFSENRGLSRIAHDG